jgi:glutathione synthase
MANSPKVGDKEIQELTRLATTYALAHGLLYLPAGDVQPPAPASAIHAPLALFPTSYPRSKFLLARKLQPLYNILYARIATDKKFLDEVMGGVDGVGKVDPFTGQLWKCWKQLRDEGVQQVCTSLWGVFSLTASVAEMAAGFVQVGLLASQPRRS